MNKIRFRSSALPVGLFLLLGAVFGSIYTNEKKDTFAAYNDRTSRILTVQPSHPIEDEGAAVDAARRWASREFAHLGSLNQGESITSGGKVHSILFSY